jgi:cytoskeletal protein CcmA (bactofilin family)
MWNKESQPEVPGLPQSKATPIPMTPLNAPSAVRPSAGAGLGNPAARSLACLGPTIFVKGEIHSEEDLQIDGKVEGPISLKGHRLTVGRSAQLNSEINAREVIVYGNVSGNLRSRDRVEIKKDGQVIGDITTTRISIEEGAYFKGHIEIERVQSGFASAREEQAPAGVGAF